MRVDLVVFDIAGTTVHDGDAVHACLAAALTLAGVPTTRDEVNALMGIPKPLAIASLVASFRKASPSDQEVDAIYDDFESLMLDHYRHGAEIRETHGATAVFRALRARGIRIALDTGFSRSIVDAILTRLGWDDSLVDATVASDEVMRGRPNPDMVWRAMELTGVTDVSRVAKVGDTPADLRQGDEAGCVLVVGVTTGSHTEEELARHPHTHLIDSLAELLPIIDDVDAAYERAPGDVSLPLLFTPGPLTTSSGVKTAMLRDLGSRDAEFIEIVARLHDRLLALAGTSRADGYAAVLLQGSGTYAVEAMLGTFVPPGGRLLVLENGAYGRRMLEIARVLGIPSIALESSPSEPIAPGDVARALERDPGITHVALVHCETTSGVINPLTAIASVVQASGHRVLVDAMSSFGGVPLDVNAGIDALVASSNKCLEGVPGVAFAIARVPLLQSSAAARSVSLDLAAQWRGFEQDGQFRFTPPTHVILALERALDELDREGGVAGRAARYRANHTRLVDGMRRLGFREVVAPEHQSDVITSFFYPEDPAFTFEDFYARLRERNFVIYPGKLTDARCFRIGSIGRLYPDDIDALLVAVRDFVTRSVPDAVDSRSRL
jgi:2-aminoethylphosphonate-pyruvate transaminase